MKVHAHLIEAPSVSEASLPEEFLHSSTDVLHLEVPAWGIKDSRRLYELATQKPVELEYRVFVIRADSLTLEAQNALLKLIEDPPQNVVFYLVVTNRSAIIPTLYSRFISVSKNLKETEGGYADEFLKLDYKGRVALIDSMHKSKDVEGMTNLVYEVAREVSKDPLSYGKECVTSVSKAASDIAYKGSSKKMILEHLALSLPVR